MKRIVAVILSFVILFTASVSAFATEETVSDEKVATLYLCSSVTLWPVVGHAFIYVENNTDEPIEVGHYEVPAGQGVSVGTLSFSVSDGWGIYYNLEAYRENKNNNMNGIYSISEELDSNEIQKLNESLKSYPNYWSFGANCATFAFAMWNSVTGDGFFSLLIPAITELMIVVAGGEKGKVQMYFPEREQVFRQRCFGEKAYLETVSDNTVR